MKLKDVLDNSNGMIKACINSLNQDFSIHINYNTKTKNMLGKTNLNIQNNLELSCILLDNYINSVDKYISHVKKFKDKDKKDKLLLITLSIINSQALLLNDFKQAIEEVVEKEVRKEK